MLLAETRKVKDLMHQARHEQTSRLAKFHSVITSNVLEGRGLEHLKIDDVTKAMSGVGKKDGVLPVVRTTNPNSHQLQKQYQQVMQYKASMPGFQWPSTSQESLWNEVASLEMLLHFGADASQEILDTTRITCLIGKPGDLVAWRQGGKLLMLVAVGQYGFLAWEAEVLAHTADHGYLQAGLCRQPSAIQWHFLADLAGWLFVPSKPACLHRFGPLILEQVAGPLELLAARIQEGLDLTIKQCQSVLAHHGIQWQSGWKKKDFYLAVFSIHLSSDQEMEDALAKSSLHAKEAEEDDGSDSELEELLEQMDFDGADPDIKQEKEKLKKKKLKKKMDAIVFTTARGRARGRGRGGRGMGRGRGRKSFSQVQLDVTEGNKEDPSLSESAGKEPASASCPGPGLEPAAEEPSSILRSGPELASEDPPFFQSLDLKRWVQEAMLLMMLQGHLWGLRVGLQVLLAMHLVLVKSWRSSQVMNVMMRLGKREVQHQNTLNLHTMFWTNLLLHNAKLHSIAQLICSP
jgi:hypothetical protein